ncbi:LSU ribosomal protein L1p (L10Ae) [hydrothermal vent metagenome]|uniref:LSU ribosomal protein L1p (L10Ae) n=1 Tax=hydrothermal vent metagenome TaxID=652676 RepID=A0A3B1DZT4_9ZZZZ
MAKKLNKRGKANDALIQAATMPPAEAIAALKKFKGPKFDQTVEIVMFLGLDTRQADQNLRGSVSLPKGIGKAKKVVAFCQSDVVDDALAAGAIKAGGEELVNEIAGGWMDFDVAVASPDMMRVASKLGKVLGPKGLMPSPKNGTVTPRVAEAVKEFAAGKVEYRADKAGNIHAVIGKMSFADADLLENLEHFVGTIEKAKPATVKGVYIKKISVSGTMTPGVQIAYSSGDEA